mmetsp:Transcript_15534/g.52428  ORF Transcript_15534/g.52428 Transcript_15534/m.52428 type:complete len:254 (-) Transcript_15534:1039-1800(-)
MSTRATRCGSPESRRSRTLCGICSASRSPFLRASPATTPSATSATCRGVNTSSTRDSWPASILAMSWQSEMRLSRSRELVHAWRTNRAPLACRSCGSWSASSSMPIIPLRGVRISWERLARKADFARSAFSRATAFMCSASRRRRSEVSSPMHTTPVTRPRSWTMGVITIWTCVASPRGEAGLTIWMSTLRLATRRMASGRLALWPVSAAMGAAAAAPPAEAESPPSVSPAAGIASWARSSTDRMATTSSRRW